MSASLDKKRADLKREIIDLSLQVQGPALDKLNIKQLEKLAELHRALIEYMENPK